MTLIATIGVVQDLNSTATVDNYVMQFRTFLIVQGFVTAPLAFNVSFKGVLVI